MPLMATKPNANTSHALIAHISQDLEAIVPGFLDNRRRDVQRLEAALEQQDLKTIELIGHRMNGDGGGYGFSAISAIGAALEQATARKDLAAIRRHTAELIDFLARVTVVYQR